METNFLDQKSDWVKLTYLKFMEFEQEYHKVFSQDRIIYKSENPHSINRFNLLWIPYKEEGDEIVVWALYVIKSFLIVELYKFYKDQKILKRYSTMFDEKYISNKKWWLYSYLLEFYIWYVILWMEVNIYVLPDSIHILNDWELDWMNNTFGHIETHIVINFNELIEKVFKKKFKSKYKRIVVTDAEMQILCEIEEKNPNYKKKQMTINFNPDETLKDLELNIHAPISMYHEIDKDLDFWDISKVKHWWIVSHVKASKKIRLKKDE